MSKINSFTKKNFPFILLIAFIIAISLVLLFDNPLAQLRGVFVEDNLIIASVLYTLILASSVIISPFTIAPAVPFVAKILGPEVTFFLTIIGWALGSSVAFLIARVGGDKFVSKLYPLEQVTRNQYGLEKDPSVLALLQVRLFAALDNFSYFSGTRTKVTFSRFVLMSIAGSLPAAFIFSFSADAIVEGEKILLFALFFAAALIFLGYISHHGWKLLERPVIVHTKKNSYIAGEIMAVAALILFFEKRNKKYQIKRTEDIEKKTEKLLGSHKKREHYSIARDISYVEMDNLFGTRKETAGVRGNGIPYGVFGLVWKKFGTPICDSEIIAKQIAEQVVWGIDADDAGVSKSLEDGVNIEQWSLSEILEHNFIEDEITHLSKEEDYKVFMKSVGFAQGFLERQIHKIKNSKAEDNSSS